MASSDASRLRVMIANEGKERLTRAVPILVALGHEVIALEIDADDVAAIIAAERPDVTLVGLGDGTRHALGLIDALVREGHCPVLVLVDERDPNFIREASSRGIFAFMNHAAIEDWQGAIDVGLYRFAEYRALQAAFRRRTLIERAKGILMERHGIDDDVAFELLRDASRTHNRKLVDLASAVADGHRLLPKQPADDPAGL
jgi:AmiR/NasT family two-component response regulator